MQIERVFPVKKTVLISLVILFALPATAGAPKLKEAVAVISAPASKPGPIDFGGGLSEANFCGEVEEGSLANQQELLAEIVKKCGRPFPGTIYIYCFPQAPCGDEVYGWLKLIYSNVVYINVEPGSSFPPAKPGPGSLVIVSSHGTSSAQDGSDLCGGHFLCDRDGNCSINTNDFIQTIQGGQGLTIVDSCFAGAVGTIPNTILMSGDSTCKRMDLLWVYLVALRHSQSCITLEQASINYITHSDGWFSGFTAAGCRVCAPSGSTNWHK